MRKVLFITIAMAFLCGNLQAQEEAYSEAAATPTKKNFIGIGTGINSDTGIFGGIVNIGLSEKSMIGFGGGLGLWGYKAGVNIQFHPKGFYKYFFKVGTSMATGASEIDLWLETEEYGEGDVSMNLKQVYNANITFGYNFKLGRSVRLFLEGGFAFNLTENSYEVLDDIQLTEEDEQFVNFMTPGGVRLAIGIDFGI